MKKQQNKEDNLNPNKETFLLKSNTTMPKKYLKIKEIGKGTFSKLYLVQNKSNFKTYCCKEILKSKIADILKFKSEINTLSKMEHPNLIRFYEVFEDDRNISIIMDKCNGPNIIQAILEKIQKGETFGEKEAAVIFKQLVSVLSYCHSQGICHRDLKPENILYFNKNPDSPIKVIDFGLSKIFGEIKPLMRGNKIEKNILSARLGTAYYMSPEVLQGNYDSKCDVWSCGVMLYLMLCGYPPFDGQNEHDIFKAISKKKFHFPEEEWRGISDDAKDLIKHILCDADKRFSADNILNHQWVEKLAPNSKEPLSKFNGNSLKNHENLYRLIKFIIEFISTKIGECDINVLRKVFEEMDANKDGSLTINEIKMAVKKLEREGIMDRFEKFELANILETDKPQKIEYNDFISACLEQKAYMREQNLANLFMMVDYDGSGKISKQEIKFALNGEIDNENLNKLIQEFDLDGDGEVDYKEFMVGMANLYKKEEEVKEEKSPQKKHK